jgi:hypothetical protein
MTRNMAGPRGQIVPIVELSTAQAASIKDGKSLVRSRSSPNAKQDCHALVPYSLEEPSPAAEAVQAAVLAAQAAVELASVLRGDTSNPSESSI